MVDEADKAEIPRPATTDEPFIGPSQTLRVRAICTIMIGGVDVTLKIKPHLINVHVILKAAGMDEATIELDDRDGKLPLPALLATVIVRMGWRYEAYSREVFNGWVTQLEYSFGRKEGGRRMFVHAKGSIPSDGKRTPKSASEGDGAPPGKQEGEKVPFEKMAQKSAELAGQVAQIHPQLASKMRDHWMQNNESHTQYMERMAEELGAIYKAVGNKSTMTIPGQNPDGSSGATLYAHWGDNLIGMRASLYIARSTYEGTSSQSYDHEKAQWGFDALKFGSGLATGQEQSTAQTGPAPSPSVGSQQNTGSGNEADMTIGEGRIVINGEPRARPHDKVQLRGVRPGVDGTWLVVDAEHIYSRTGYITWLDVRPWFVAGGVNVLDGAQYIDRAGTPQSLQEAQRLRQAEILRLQAEADRQRRLDQEAAGREGLP